MALGGEPALWRGHLKNILPKRRKLTRGHMAAMPFENVPAFMVDVRASEAMSACALEFTMLSAARTGEVLGARWPEINFDKAVWLPGDRMKAGVAHAVPLSKQAMALLRRLHETKISDFVFPGEKQGKSLSGMAMEMLLRRLQVTDATVHGFRSSFRDWAGDKTSFPRELAEAALAHMQGAGSPRLEGLSVPWGGRWRSEEPGSWSVQAWP